MVTKISGCVTVLERSVDSDESDGRGVSVLQPMVTSPSAPRITRHCGWTPLFLPVQCTSEGLDLPLLACGSGVATPPIKHRTVPVLYSTAQ